MGNGIREPVTALFVAIPRTGSLSMIEALRPVGIESYNLGEGGHFPCDMDLDAPIVTFNHASIASLIDFGVITTEWAHARWAFAVVRNPWDRLVSLYRYLWGTLAGRYTQYAPHTFPRFVEQVTSQFNQPIGMYNWRGLSMASPQSEWLRELCVTQTVYKFENLPGAITHISLRLGQDIRMPHLNTTERRPYPEYYSPALRDAIGEYYAEDIKRFAYTFED